MQNDLASMYVADQFGLAADLGYEIVQLVHTTPAEKMSHNILSGKDAAMAFLLRKFARRLSGTSLNATRLPGELPANVASLSTEKAGA
jgi:hypothetical protein